MGEDATDEPEPEPELEWKLRAAAIPAAIVLAVAFHAWPFGHYLQRTFLSMMVHEVGHATTAWWSGIAAIPTLWKTLIPETRSTIVPIAVLALEGFLVYRGWITKRWHLAYIGLGLALVQFIGTVSTSLPRVHEAITFGGDGGAMVLGTCLMLTFFSHPSSRLRTNQLRWGFLVIGAAALVDTFATWWASSSDSSMIPYGEIEGVGLSDPSKLSETYGWTDDQIVHRYLVVGYVCFAALALVWLAATWRARQLRSPNARDHSDI